MAKLNDRCLCLCTTAMLVPLLPLGIFGGKSQTSFSRNATPAGSEVRRHLTCSPLPPVPGRLSIPSYTESIIYDHVSRSVTSSKIWRVYKCSFLQGNTFCRFSVFICSSMTSIIQEVITSKIYSFKLKSNFQNN